MASAKDDLRRRLEAELLDSERAAWDALARHKFWMAGYHAADVVKLRRRLGSKGPSPFRQLVDLARVVMLAKYGVRIPSK